jgi:hypothetical protein
MAFGASDAARWQSYQTRARIGANLWLLLFRLALLSWIILTMWIVWYETGEAFPQLNHAYFWTWVGVGLLTDVSVLNLAAAHAKWPINGAWVPFPALAQSLNGQQFYWQPFVTWYWHYGRWTILIPPVVFVIAVIISLPRRQGHGACTRSTSARATPAQPQIKRRLVKKSRARRTENNRPTCSRWAATPAIRHRVASSRTNPSPHPNSSA